jgi:hypothetical protein
MINRAHLQGFSSQQECRAQEVHEVHMRGTNEANEAYLQTAGHMKPKGTLAGGRSLQEIWGTLAGSRSHRQQSMRGKRGYLRGEVTRGTWDRQAAEHTGPWGTQAALVTRTGTQNYAVNLTIQY